MAKKRYFFEGAALLLGKKLVRPHAFLYVIFGSSDKNTKFLRKSPERFSRNGPELFGKIFARCSVISHCPPAQNFSILLFCSLSHKHHSVKFLCVNSNFSPRTSTSKNPILRQGPTLNLCTKIYNGH